MIFHFRFLATCLASALLVSSACFSQIPNSGFENWTSGNPDGWSTSNNPLFTNVTQSTTAHSDSFAARGDVVTFFMTAAQPVLQVGPDARGFAYNERPAAFTGYYEFFPQGGDRFAINVGLFKGGIDGITVAIAAAAPSATVSSFTQFNVPFNYLTTDTPDTCIVQIQIVGPSSGTDYHVGSYFILDDIALSGAVGVAVRPDNMPITTGLLQNYPNPFNPSTKISYTVSTAGMVSLTVMDVLGREVGTLVSAHREPGNYAEMWDASNQPAGVYFYRLVANNAVEVRKMMLVK